VNCAGANGGGRVGRDAKVGRRLDCRVIDGLFVVDGLFVIDGLFVVGGLCGWRVQVVEERVTYRLR
jgi:hypothetical protein